MNTTSIDDLASTYGLKVYPHPATEEVNIEFTSPTNAQAALTVYNASGQIISSTKRQINFGENRMQVNLSDFPTGIYFYDLSGGNAPALRGSFLVRK